MGIEQKIKKNQNSGSIWVDMHMEVMTVPLLIRISSSSIVDNETKCVRVLTETF